MEIVYKNGDLFDGDELIVIHGTNIQGRYASGFAKIVRERFPKAYQTYMIAYRSNNLTLGSINYVSENGRLIVNAATQEFYGYDKKQYVSYEAVRDAFKELNKLILQINVGVQNFKGIPSTVSAVSMPLIGCGLGGGAWSIISKIIEEESTNFTPVVYIVDGIIPL